MYDRPKILFFGDPHGDFEPVFEAVERMQPEAIVLLGDLQARQPLHLELAPILDKTAVWFIHGNHDTDSDEDFDHLFRSELGDRNLDGQVQTIAGYRIAGLGWAESSETKSGIRPCRCSRPPSPQLKRWLPMREGEGLASKLTCGRLGAAASCASTTQASFLMSINGCPR